MEKIYQEFAHAHQALKAAREQMRHAEGILREAKERFWLAETQLTGKLSGIVQNSNGYSPVRQGHRDHPDVMEMPELG